MISDLGLAYSIRKRLEERLGFDVHIVNDRFQYPDEKPFALIRSMQNNNQQLSKLRETINTTFRYEVSVFAEYAYKRSEYQSILRRVFLFEEFDYYDEMGIKTDKKFLIEPDFSEVPIPNDDKSSDTKNHRIFFDLEINVMTHKNN